MPDATWNGSEWVLTQESPTVTPAEAPTNDNTSPVVSNYLICDRTGFKIPVAEGLREEWNGQKVRKESWEPRNAQDFVRSLSEELNGSSRPEQDDYFLGTNEVQASEL